VNDPPPEDAVAMMIWKAWLPVKPRLSVTVIVKLKVLAALEIPEITPLEVTAKVF